MTNKEIVERLERLERDNAVLRTFFIGVGGCFRYACQEMHEHHWRPEEVPA